MACVSREYIQNQGAVVGPSLASYCIPIDYLLYLKSPERYSYEQKHMKSPYHRSKERRNRRTIHRALFAYLQRDAILPTMPLPSHDQVRAMHEKHPTKVPGVGTAPALGGTACPT